MTSTVETRTETKPLSPSSASLVHLEKVRPEHSSPKVLNKKGKLTEEIIAYKAEKDQELNWAKRLNRWSIGIALALTAATTLSGYSEDTAKFTMPLGTLAVTLNGWIASIPMSKRVGLYERILVKVDNLRSDLEFEAETELDLEEIREEFKSLKIEFIQENPREQVKLHSVKSPIKS